MPQRRNTSAFAPFFLHISFFFCDFPPVVPSHVRPAANTFQLIRNPYEFPHWASISRTFRHSRAPPLVELIPPYSPPFFHRIALRVVALAQSRAFFFPSFFFLRPLHDDRERVFASYLPELPPTMLLVASVLFISSFLIGSWFSFVLPSY